MRNTNNQLKIHAFDDYFGYRALIDEVNVWVLPDIGEEPGGGLTLKGPTEDEKAIESRLEEGCYYLLFDARTHRGANQEVRDWVSRVLSPTHLICHADEQFQRLWFPAYGLLPAGTMPNPAMVKTRRTGNADDHLLSRSHRTSDYRADHEDVAGRASGTVKYSGDRLRSMACG